MLYLIFPTPWFGDVQELQMLMGLVALVCALKQCVYGSFIDTIKE